MVATRRTVPWGLTGHRLTLTTLEDSLIRADSIVGFDLNLIETLRLALVELGNTLTEWGCFMLTIAGFFPFHSARRDGVESIQRHLVKQKYLSSLCVTSGVPPLTLHHSTELSPSINQFSAHLCWSGFW